jgi:hypothetical protein
VGERHLTGTQWASGGVRDGIGLATNRGAYLLFGAQGVSVDERTKVRHGGGGCAAQVARTQCAGHSGVMLAVMLM